MKNFFAVVFLIYIGAYGVHCDSDTKSKRDLWNSVRGWFWGKPTEKSNVEHETTSVSRQTSTSTEASTALSFVSSIKTESAFSDNPTTTALTLPESTVVGNATDTTAAYTLDVQNDKTSSYSNSTDFLSTEKTVDEVQNDIVSTERVDIQGLYFEEKNFGFNGAEAAITSSSPGTLSFTFFSVGLPIFTSYYFL